jgi:DNA-binding XRE family transcriptional regulator
MSPSAKNPSAKKKRAAATRRKVPRHARAATTGGVVTLKREAYEALIGRLEEAEDLVEARRVLAATKPEDYLALAEADRLAAGESPVRVWREHRNLTMQALAAKSGVPQPYISEIETGKKPGSLKAMAALAKALGLAIDDLVRI